MSTIANQGSPFSAQPRLYSPAAAQPGSINLPMKHAALVVTNSGGIQEETTCLGVPCITVRENTERPITVSSGTNTIAGTQTERIRNAIKAQTNKVPSARAPEKWDGRAGTRIVEAIVLDLQRSRSTMRCSFEDTPRRADSVGDTSGTVS